MALTDTGISSKLPKLIEAIIDAYMMDEGFTGGCAEGQFRSYAVVDLSSGTGETFTPVDIEVSYPGGEWTQGGGGPWLDSWAKPFDAKEYFGRFDTAVLAAFKKWEKLPDPGAIQDAATTVGSVAGSLRGGGAYVVGEGDADEGDADEDDAPDGGGEIEIGVGNQTLQKYVDTLTSELDDCAGETVEALHNNYIAWVPDSLAGQHVLALVLKAAVDGEKTIWKSVRDGLPELVDQATQEFHDHSEGVGAGAELAAKIKSGLEAIGTVAAIGSLVVTGGTGATVIGAAGTVSSLLTGFLPAPPKPPDTTLSGGSADEMLSSLFEILNLLDQHIHDHEARFQQALINATTVYHERPGAFDIKPNRGLKPFKEEKDKGDIYHVGEEIAVINERLEDAAVRFELIGNLQGRLAQTLSGALGSGPWSRTSLGLGPVGHHPQYAELGQTLVDLLTNSHQEMTSVAERIMYVVSDFTATDAQIAKDLDRLADKVKDDIEFQLSQG